MTRRHNLFDLNPQQMMRDNPLLFDLYLRSVDKMGLALKDVAQLVDNPIEEAVLAACVAFYFFKIAMCAAWNDPERDAGSRTRVSELVQLNARMLFETFMREYDDNPTLRKQFGAKE